MDDGAGEHSVTQSGSAPEATHKPPKRNWPSAVAKLLLGAGLLTGLLWWLGPDWTEVRSKLELHWGYLVLGFVGTALATAFTAARWQLLNERMTPTRLPYGAYFHYVAVTRFFGQFFPMLFMEFVGRGVGLRAAGSKQGLGRLVTPVLLERLLDLLLPGVMLMWALAIYKSPTLDAHRWTFLAALTVVFAVGIIPLIRPIADRAVALYIAIKRWRGADVVHEPVELSTSTAAWVSAHSLGRYATVLLQFFGMGAAAGALFPAKVIMSGFAVAQLSAVLAITPGGLGIQDAGWLGGLRWQGQEEAIIALFLLSFRVLVLANFGLLSLLTLPLRGGRPTTPSTSDAT